MFYLYTCLYHEFFVLVKANFRSVSEASKFRVNSLSIVYHCAIHNLPTLRPLARDLNLTSALFSSDGFLAIVIFYFVYF